MKKRIWKFWKKEIPREKGYFETVNAADNNVTEWIGGSNEHVTGAYSAMKLAAVFRCTDVLSGSIASLPLQLKVKKNGVFQLADNSYLNYLLTVNANNRQNAFDMLQNAVIQMVNAGNAYILPVYRIGEIESLILLSPFTTTYDKQNNLYYVNDTINGIIGTFESDDIIHLRNISLDGGYTGVSTIQYASRAMNISANADERTLDSFKPGSTLRGFISGDAQAGIQGFGGLQDDQLKAITDRITEEINSGKNIFNVPGQSKFNQLSLTPTDLQLLETRKFSVLDICRFYGVHPDKVFAGQSQNYKASELSNNSFLADTLQSRLRKIECEFTSKLIPKELVHKMKIEFDVESLMLTDAERSASYMEKTIQSGVYTVNHWRAKKGQIPVEGGDQVLVSCNVAPINSEKIIGGPQILPPKNDDAQV